MWQYRSFSSLNVKQCKFLELQWENGWLLWVSFLNRNISLLSKKNYDNTLKPVRCWMGAKEKHLALYRHMTPVPLDAFYGRFDFDWLPWKRRGPLLVNHFSAWSERCGRNGERWRERIKQRSKTLQTLARSTEIPSNVLILWLFYTWLSLNPNYRLLTLNGCWLWVEEHWRNGKMKRVMSLRPGRTS